MRWLFVILFAGLGLMLVYVGVTQFFMQRRIAALPKRTPSQCLRTLNVPPPKPPPTPRRKPPTSNLRLSAFKNE